MEFINMPHANRNKLLARVWLLERHDRSSSLILSTNKHTGDLTYCIWIYFLLLVHLPINRVDLENEMIYGKRWRGEEHGTVMMKKDVVDLLHVRDLWLYGLEKSFLN